MMITRVLVGFPSAGRRPTRRAVAVRGSLCAAAAAVTADLTSAGRASGNIDHSSAMAPVTNGAAALVPPDVTARPLVPRLVMCSPGAINPRRPIELPRLDDASGQPRASHATTGITQGCRVIAELPSGALIARRCDYDHASPGGVRERLLEPRLLVRRGRRKSNTEVQNSRARIDAVDDRIGQARRGSRSACRLFRSRLEKDRPHQQRAAGADRRRGGFTSR